MQKTARIGRSKKDPCVSKAFNIILSHMYENRQLLDLNDIKPSGQTGRFLLGEKASKKYCDIVLAFAHRIYAPGLSFGAQNLPYWAIREEDWLAFTQRGPGKSQDLDFLLKHQLELLKGIPNCEVRLLNGLSPTPFYLRSLNAYLMLYQRNKEPGRYLFALLSKEFQKLDQAIGRGKRTPPWSVLAVRVGATSEVIQFASVALALNLSLSREHLIKIREALMWSRFDSKESLHSIGTILINSPAIGNALLDPPEPSDCSDNLMASDISRRMRISVRSFWKYHQIYRQMLRNAHLFTDEYDRSLSKDTLTYYESTLGNRPSFYLLQHDEIRTFINLCIGEKQDGIQFKRPVEGLNWLEARLTALEREKQRRKDNPLQARKLGYNVEELHQFFRQYWFFEGQDVEALSSSLSQYIELDLKRRRSIEARERLNAMRDQDLSATECFLREIGDLVCAVPYQEKIREGPIARNRADKNFRAYAALYTRLNNKSLFSLMIEPDLSQKSVVLNEPDGDNPGDTAPISLHIVEYIAGQFHTEEKLSELKDGSADPESFYDALSQNLLRALSWMYTPPWAHLTVVLADQKILQRLKDFLYPENPEADSLFHPIIPLGDGFPTELHDGWRKNFKLQKQNLSNANYFNNLWNDEEINIKSRQEWHKRIVHINPDMTELLKVLEPIGTVKRGEIQTRDFYLSK